MIESAFALTIAFLINISIISVSGAVCGSDNLSPEDQMNCSDLDLNKASFLLKVGQQFCGIHIIVFEIIGQTVHFELENIYGFVIDSVICIM